MLEPDAVKVARPVLRGPGRSNAFGLPDKSTGSYPRVHVDTAKVTAVGQAGGILLTETIRAAGLDRALSEALSRWRKPLAVHDPGNIICELAMSLVLGGEALSDLDTLGAEPGVYGPVSSDPTVSRLIAALAEDADKAIKAIAGARQQAGATVWALAGEHAPDHESTAEDPVVIDLDASLITAHSADAGGCDVQARLRVPPVAGVRRPRT